MAVIANVKQEEVIIPNRLQTFEDKKTGVRTVSFPFTFPDGTPGISSITRLKKGAWEPSDDIKSVIINFNENKPSTGNSVS